MGALMSGLLIQAVSSTAAQTSKEGQVDFIGSYSQLKETGEHVYGYILELWRDGSAVVGLWSRAEGQPADFPAVLVTDVQWDEAKGSLRFTARWCKAPELARCQRRIGCPLQR